VSKCKKQAVESKQEFRSQLIKTRSDRRGFSDQCTIRVAQVSHDFDWSRNSSWCDIRLPLTRPLTPLMPLRVQRLHGQQRGKPQALRRSRTRCQLALSILQTSRPSLIPRRPTQLSDVLAEPCLSSPGTYPQCQRSAPQAPHTPHAQSTSHSSTPGDSPMNTTTTHHLPMPNASPTSLSVTPHNAVPAHPHKTSRHLPASAWFPAEYAGYRSRATACDVL
jgi:hypothetical protein